MRTTINIIAVVLAISAMASGARADWPNPALRSGGYLPPVRQVAVSLNASGAYVPRVGNLAGDTSAVLEGGLTWNFAFDKRVGLFGHHTIGGMWCANVSLLSLGHEVGMRFPLVDVFTLEAAYLTHRVDSAWTDGLKIRPGGIMDSGGELGFWLHFSPVRRFKIEPHVFGRVFGVYTDVQGVTGVGLRTSVMPFDGHSLGAEIQLLPTIRHHPRQGVEKVTWNVVGSIFWRSRITGDFGLQIGGMISTNLLVGQVPMLELKRSMINEPMAMGTVGIYFGI